LTTDGRTDGREEKTRKETCAERRDWAFPPTKSSQGRRCRASLLLEDVVDGGVVLEAVAWVGPSKDDEVFFFLEDARAVELCEALRDLWFDDARRNAEDGRSRGDARDGRFEDLVYLVGVGVGDPPGDEGVDVAEEVAGLGLLQAGPKLAFDAEPPAPGLRGPAELTLTGRPSRGLGPQRGPVQKLAQEVLVLDQLLRRVVRSVE